MIRTIALVGALFVGVTVLAYGIVMVLPAFIYCVQQPGCLAQVKPGS